MGARWEEAVELGRKVAGKGMELGLEVWVEAGGSLSKAESEGGGLLSGLLEGKFLS